MIDMYEYLQEYDYYLRIDSDCFLTNIGYNILEWAETQRLQYAWVAYGMESHKPTTDTLYPWIENYTKEHNVTPTALLGNKLSAPLTFYNNFHIGKVCFFDRSDVKRFLSGKPNNPCLSRSLF